MNIIRKIDREQGEMDRLVNTTKKPLSPRRTITYNPSYGTFLISTANAFEDSVVLTKKEGRALLKYFTEVFDEG